MITEKTKKSSSADQIREVRKEKAKENAELKSAVEAKLNLARDRAQNAVLLSVEKAVAHFENPSMYPLPPGGENIERVFYDVLNLLPKNRRKKVVEKVNETLKASPQTRAQRFKDIVNMDFKSSLPIVEQVKAKAVPAELKFTEEETNHLHLLYRFEKPAVKTNGTPVPRQAVSSNNVGFFVDNLKCLNPDDVYKDEINLAGFAIDTAGNRTELAPFFVGKFRKDETVLLNGNSKLFTLPIDSAQDTQNFLAGLFIVEKDLISNEELVEKLSLLFALIGIACLAIGLTLLFVPPVPFLVPAILIIASVPMNFMAHYFIPLMGDDISLAVTDTLTFDGKLDVGSTFERSLTIGKGFDINSTFDGKYTAAARWVGEL